MFFYPEFTEKVFCWGFVKNMSAYVPCVIFDLYLLINRNDVYDNKWHILIDTLKCYIF